MAAVPESSGLDEAFGGGADGRRWPYVAAQPSESSDSAWLTLAARGAFLGGFWKIGQWGWMGFFNTKALV